MGSGPAAHSRVIVLLDRWSHHAERYWCPMPDRPELGCYGTGYNSWGVQTNQKYLSAMAVLGVCGKEVGDVPAGVCDQARERALAALRFSLESHVSGAYACTDGTQWGHTWISALGIERMMHGVDLVAPFLDASDRAALRRVLISESERLLTDHVRGRFRGVFADPWNASGKNAPESNLWNGALLWRTAMMYPDHPHAGDWREQAHRFLLNAISVPADAQDERAVAGMPVRGRHVGANFFPNYALDHHGYLNVGYVVICLSNAAMLYFGMLARGLSSPESLAHHNRDLWQVARRMVLSNGRLARIGGDSRLRYTYCQEYLLPTLVYSAVLGEPHSGYLIDQQLGWIEQEAAFGSRGATEHQGSFYGRRLARLVDSSTYYYTRLESDRACALGMLLVFGRQLDDARDAAPDEADSGERLAFERSASGLWCEPEYGAVMHRTPSRLASFAWRAHGLAQGMCLPPTDGHLAEWHQNLAGLVRFAGDPGAIQGGQTSHRDLLGFHIDAFENGFATCGAVEEGVDLDLAEGWHCTRSGVHQIAFVALPDGHTVIGLEHCRTVDHGTYVLEVKGLHLNLPNDLFNQFVRTLVTAEGRIALSSPPARDQVLGLGGTWANVEERLGVVGMYGADGLVVHRSTVRRGGLYASLYVDEICFGCDVGNHDVGAGTTLLDVGWAVLSGVTSECTRQSVQGYEVVASGDREDGLRGAVMQGLDGVLYAVVANFCEERVDVREQVCGRRRLVRDLASGRYVDAGGGTDLWVMPGRVRAFALIE